MAGADHCARHDARVDGRRHLDLERTPNRRIGGDTGRSLAVNRARDRDHMTAAGQPPEDHANPRSSCVRSVKPAQIAVRSHPGTLFARWFHR